MSTGDHAPKRPLDSAALLAAIVENSDDAIVSKDLDGVIISWNRAAERMFGYPAQEAVGASIRIIVPDDRQQEETKILDRIRRGERIDHFETNRRRRDGSPVPVSLTISPIRDPAGLLIGASTINRDISDRQRAEQLADLDHRRARARSPAWRSPTRIRRRSIWQRNCGGNTKIRTPPTACRR